MSDNRKRRVVQLCTDCWEWYDANADVCPHCARRELAKQAAARTFKGGAQQLYCDNCNKPITSIVGACPHCGYKGLG